MKQWQECDERAHIIDSLRNGDCTIMKQFVRVGEYLFNVDNINAVNLFAPDGLVNIFMSDSTEGNGYVSKGYQLDADAPETQAFVAWLTDASRCIDVMVPEPKIDGQPNG